jgi:hypothetical protein
MSEIGEQEDLFAQNLEDYRAILKQIRNTESSVQPSRDNKAKISDEIQKLKYKEPTSPKLVTLEQELVRAEAQNLVAEAQLTNIVSRCGLLINAFMLTIGQDTSKVEGSVRPPLQIPFHALGLHLLTIAQLRPTLRSDDRAGRKANHPRQIWPSPAQLPRRHPRRPR